MDDQDFIRDERSISPALSSSTDSMSESGKVKSSALEMLVFQLFVVVYGQSSWIAVWLGWVDGRTDGRTDE